MTTDKGKNVCKAQFNSKRFMSMRCLKKSVLTLENCNIKSIKCECQKGFR